MKLSRIGLATAIIATASCTAEHEVAGPISRPSFSVVGCTGDLVANGQALRAAIEDTSTGTISLQPCTYEVAALWRDGYNSGILIGNKNNLTIEGAGSSTIVKFQRPVWIGFEIRSNTTNLTIRNMIIAGSITQSLCEENPDLDDPVFEPRRCYGDSTSVRPNSAGIGTRIHQGQVGINGVVLANLEVRDLAIGIMPGSGGDCNESYMNVTVQDNYVHDIYGAYSGSGYGIVNNCAQNVAIRKNTVVRAERHAIYQPGTILPTNPHPVVIIGNTIVDHGHGRPLGLDKPDWTALTVARSDNVIVIDNKLVGGHAIPMSAEYADGKSCTRCVLIGNRFLNVGARPDIWINASHVVRTWSNVRNHGDPPWFKDDTGMRREVKGPWADTQAITSMYHADAGEDHIYIMENSTGNSTLHRVDPSYGIDPESWTTYFYSETNWSPNFFGMTADDGKVYVLQGGWLHSVTPVLSNSAWPFTYSMGWPNAGAMASRGDGYLYVIPNSILHRVTPSDWSYIYSTTGWSSPWGMAAGNGVVYVRSGNFVYEVTPGTHGTAWPWSVLDF